MFFERVLRLTPILLTVTLPVLCLAGQARPLTADEVAALRWIDYVTGALPVDKEQDWWKIGGTQHGLFAKRYNIAFAGYAAAALGMRGDGLQRAAVGRILGNCLSRYLKRDVWAYSQSKNYWGQKPWAPDPCYRENVMYTGHLLQLLALYEMFTGDVLVLEIADILIIPMILNFYGSATRCIAFALINGSGNTKLNLAVALIDGIMMRIGLAALLCFVFGMGSLGCWYGDAIAGFMPIVIGTVFFLSGRWRMKNRLST